MRLCVEMFKVFGIYFYYLYIYQFIILKIEIKLVLENLYLYMKILESYLMEYKLYNLSVYLRF